MSWLSGLVRPTGQPRFSRRPPRNFSPCDGRARRATGGDSRRGDDERPQERHDPEHGRPAVDRHRLPARQAGQGRRLRAHQAQERDDRQGRRPHVQRGRQDRDRNVDRATCTTCTRTATASCSWTPPTTTRSRCPGARRRCAELHAREPERHHRRCTTATRCTSNCPPPSSSRSATPSRACRATAPPAAPSRPRWRPATRSRCRCSLHRREGQGRHARRQLPRPRQQRLPCPLAARRVSAPSTCCSRRN